MLLSNRKVKRGKFFANAYKHKYKIGKLAKPSQILFLKLVIKLKWMDNLIFFHYSFIVLGLCYYWGLTVFFTWQRNPNLHCWKVWVLGSSVSLRLLKALIKFYPLLCKCFGALKRVWASDKDISSLPQQHPSWCSCPLGLFDKRILKL